MESNTANPNPREPPQKYSTWRPSFSPEDGELFNEARIILNEELMLSGDHPWPDNYYHVENNPPESFNELVKYVCETQKQVQKSKLRRFYNRFAGFQYSIGIFSSIVDEMTRELPFPSGSVCKLRSHLAPGNRKS